MKRYFNVDDRSILNEDITTSIKNLNSLDNRQTTLFDSRSAMISELVFSVFDGIQSESIDDVRKKYHLVSPSQLKAKDISKHPKPNELQKYFDAISCIEKLSLCREIYSAFGDKKSPFELLFDSYEPCSSEAASKIAYVKNNFTDIAYLKFAEALKKAKFSYLSSFELVCEEVFSGKCEFCILPVETSSDGKLFTFYSMIDKYELKIIALCSVLHSDEQKSTTFALLRKSLLPIDILSLNPEATKKIRLEMRIPQAPSGASPLHSIIQAATACDLQLCGINSMPLIYRDNLMSYYAVFNIHGSDLNTFMTYIALEFPQCYTVGFYSSID